ncbi:MAG: ABC transporter ATP-binding protein [Limnochordia bacterium]|jgi:ATP-binding cassette subfamily B multidrug efflux pump|nr:ABC transporter ATP-binding protein [Bacillota bacterium]NLL07584.1 ABC transporter ATP-binding protein [Bacillota bacterium]HBG09525.1 multidrug ABC transporter ATP-binding protein [Bacillota bacterium]
MWKLRQYAKPYLFTVIVVSGLVFLEVMATLRLPDLMSRIVDEGIARGNLGLIWRVGALMLAVALGGVVCSIAGNYLASRASGKFGRDVRLAVFRRVGEFSPREFDQFGAASLITRTTNDVQQIQHMFRMSMRMAMRAPLMAVGGVLMVVRKDAQLAMILLGLIPVMAALVALVMSKGVPLFKSLQEKLDRLNQVVREQLMGVRVIRAFNRGEDERARFAKANRDLTATALRVSRIMITLMPLLGLLINFTNIVIIWFAAQRIDAGIMEVGDLMAFLQYTMQTFMAVMMLSMIFVNLPRASASAQRIAEVLQTEPSITDPAEPQAFDAQLGVVEFEGVTFSYPGAEVPVLSGISFTAKPGQVTALIGGTGSGKSTILELLLRFHDPDSGRITLDGVDIRSASQSDLRSRVGYVPQQAVLFSGTVASNIRHGKQDATDEEVREAARIAQALDFVSEREGGFEGEVAQGGTNLSGGQKQRLSIARAVVRRPQIYLLDDSFSALDYKTDAKLRQELAEAARDATVIVVAQRVSTIMHADQILVLEAGRIVGQGTHETLLEDCRVYQEIVASQFGEEAAS